jgi:hypothetical protein
VKEGFYTFLDAYRSQRHLVSTNDVEQDLGALYARWIDTRWRGPAFAFVQDAFNEYFATTYRTSVSAVQSRRYHEHAALADRFTHIPIVEAAKLLGTSYDRVTGYTT